MCLLIYVYVVCVFRRMLVWKWLRMHRMSDFNDKSDSDDGTTDDNENGRRRKKMVASDVTGTISIHYTP